MDNCLLLLGQICPSIFSPLHTIFSLLEETYKDKKTLSENLFSIKIRYLDIGTSIAQTIELN